MIQQHTKVDLSNKSNPEVDLTKLRYRISNVLTTKQLQQLKGYSKQAYYNQLLNEKGIFIIG